MIYRSPRMEERGVFNSLAKHPLQSWEWGDFRETTGVSVERAVGFEGAEAKKQLQITFHPIPKLPYTVGYFPKGEIPNEMMSKTLLEMGKRNKALMIKIEPDVYRPIGSDNDLSEIRKTLLNTGYEKGRSLFTPYSFMLDLTKTEDQLLKNMKSKTRYNLRLAEKKGVTVEEDTSIDGFEEYLELLKLTTKRQSFYAHTEKYQRNMWKFMNKAGIARVLKAKYEGRTLAAWVMFVFNDTLYYPYGASSRENREVMASNLLMWEAIKFGKKLNLKTLDMWGSLGPNASPKDSWFGFHKFKEGYGATLMEFVGTYDLVIEPQLYKLYRIADRWRWRYLRLKSKFSF